MSISLCLGERYRGQLEQVLHEKGITAIWLPDHPQLDHRIAGHADLSLCRIGHTLIAAEHLLQKEEVVNYLTNRGFTLLPSQRAQGKSYPADAGLCACAVGRHLICHKDYTDPAIIENWLGEFVIVRQAYVKCSVCPVSDDALITADEGIARTAKEHGLDVMLIHCGGIRLDGYGYGFIGGASIILKDSVLFTGFLENIPEANEIVSFIERHGKQAVMLTKEEAFDIGGGIVLE